MVAFTGCSRHFVPGFRQFRFPAKLFTFTALALAALAGVWAATGLRAGRNRGAIQNHCDSDRDHRLLAPWRSHRASGCFWKRLEGSIRARCLVPSTPRRGSGDCPIIGARIGRFAAIGLLALAGSSRTCELRPVLVLIAVSFDLAVANSRFIFTVPQSLFDTKPEVLELIEREERARPTPGPFRSPPHGPMEPSSAGTRHRRRPA